MKDIFTNPMCNQIAGDRFPYIVIIAKILSANSYRMNATFYNEIKLEFVFFPTKCVFNF